MVDYSKVCDATMSTCQDLGKKLLIEEQKRAVCKRKQANPKMTSRELYAWVTKKFKVGVHKATICKVLKMLLMLLSNRSTT